MNIHKMGCMPKTRTELLHFPTQDVLRTKQQSPLLWKTARTAITIDECAFNLCLDQSIAAASDPLRQKCTSTGNLNRFRFDGQKIVHACGLPKFDFHPPDDPDNLFAMPSIRKLGMMHADQPQILDPPPWSCPQKTGHAQV